MIANEASQKSLEQKEPMTEPFFDANAVMKKDNQTISQKLIVNRTKKNSSYASNNLKRSLLATLTAPPIITH